jgi:hypothetical protein
VLSFCLDNLRADYFASFICPVALECSYGIIDKEEYQADEQSYSDTYCNPEGGRIPFVIFIKYS